MYKHIYIEYTKRTCTCIFRVKSIGLFVIDNEDKYLANNDVRGKKEDNCKNKVSYSESAIVKIVT